MNPPIAPAGPRRSLLVPQVTLRRRLLVAATTAAEAMTFGASEDDRRRASRDLDQFAKALRALMPARPE